VAEVKNDKRIASYKKQSGKKDLTPKQARRVRKVDNKEKGVKK